ncbi:MAG TPA: alpha/beta hydrolase-fold protein [Verrucomicrobiae bacterium]|nr:alpha/beta hydrolase-fold protein [Verrucomicrobiae bacterium]
MIARKDDPAPRLTVGETGPDAPVVLGRDADNWLPEKSLTVDEKAAAFPMAKLADLPAGDYFVQALLTCNIDLRSPRAEGNLFSQTQKVHVDPSHGQTVQLELVSPIPPPAEPQENDWIKFVKIQSKLLSDFHKRPIYLRAGVLLPPDFVANPHRKYPLFVRIGGLDTRYWQVLSLMAEGSGFRKAWLADGTPRMIVLQLDGAGPWGDAYQVNSANNGPYGDAITQELIPYVEEKFRAVGQPKARVLSGGSTGGWASLALQVFYPDFFNGTWSSCPDGVDFRAFELVNIYSDENAYLNNYGFERPSEREVTGEVKLTMRREVQLENVMGRGNSWTTSGGQWCAWNATYGPRGADGLPVPLWDPQTGIINHAVAEQWKPYDLRLVMEKNWATLGPKLRGKLHISVGDADSYFLNNAVHLLDDFLSHAKPPYEGRVVYGPGKGHCWSDVSTVQMLKEMAAVTGGPED